MYDLFSPFSAKMYDLFSAKWISILRHCERCQEAMGGILKGGLQSPSQLVAATVLVKA